MKKSPTPGWLFFHRFRKLYDFSGIAVRCLLCGGRLGGQTKKWPDWKLFFGAAILSTLVSGIAGNITVFLAVFLRRLFSSEVEPLECGSITCWPGRLEKSKASRSSESRWRSSLYRKKLVILSSHEQHSDLRCGREANSATGQTDMPMVSTSCFW